MSSGTTTIKMYHLTKDLCFGPTRQGEGPQAGQHCFFVRFAGCDFECSFCDTPYSISPKFKDWVRLPHSAESIGNMLTDLGAEWGDWITLSGGNPAIQVDFALAAYLAHVKGFKLAMETQGSKSMDPMVNNAIHSMVVSPKPPSSGMDGKFNPLTVVNLIKYRPVDLMTTLKYVAFDEKDMEWILFATDAIRKEAGSVLGHVQLYITPGTPVKSTVWIPAAQLEQERANICDSMLRIWEVANKDPRFNEYRIVPQLHALAYGQKAGV